MLEAFLILRVSSGKAQHKALGMWDSNKEQNLLCCIPILLYQWLGTKENEEILLFRPLC